MKTASYFSLTAALAILGCQTSSGGTLFNVTATLATSSCGAAVTVSASEEFQVRITQSDDTLTWYDLDTGDSTQGSISSNAFTLARIDVFQITAASAESAGCSVRRHDSYSGTLTKSGQNITKIEADVDSNYTEASGYFCDALIGSKDGFSDLPCEVKYSLVGTPAK